jgi:hypothetical protein
VINNLTRCGRSVCTCYVTLAGSAPWKQSPVSPLCSLRFQTCAVVWVTPALSFRLVSTTGIASGRNLGIHKLSISPASILLFPLLNPILSFSYVASVLISVERGALRKSILPFSAKILFTAPCTKALTSPSHPHSCPSPPLSSSSVARSDNLLLLDASLSILHLSFRHSFRKQRFKTLLANLTMNFLTFLTFAVVLVTSLLCAHQASASRSSPRRRDLDSPKPVSELGWKVPLQSGETHAKVKLRVKLRAHCIVRHTCTSASHCRQDIEVPHPWPWHYDL